MKSTHSYINLLLHFDSEPSPKLASIQLALGHRLDLSRIHLQQKPLIAFRVELRPEYTPVHRMRIGVQITHETRIVRLEDRRQTDVVKIKASGTRSCGCVARSEYVGQLASVGHAYPSGDGSWRQNVEPTRSSIPRRWDVSRDSSPIVPRLGVFCEHR